MKPETIDTYTFNLEAKRRFLRSGVKNWDKIPDEIREKESTLRIKAGFKEYLFNLRNHSTIPLVEQRYRNFQFFSFFFLRLF